MYKNKNTLTRHQLYECGGKKTFQCPYCSKRFAQKQDIRRHGRANDILSEIKPSMDTCQKVSTINTRKSSLNTTQKRDTLEELSRQFITPHDKYFLPLPDAVENNMAPEVDGTIAKYTVKSLDLDKLLASTQTGNAIKSYYRKQQQLDARCQSYLTDIIVEYFLNSPSKYRRLNNSDFDNISQKIIKCFPNESALVYYTPPIYKKLSKVNKSIMARGKLVDKYRNKLTFFRQSGALSTTAHEDEKEKLSDHVYNPDVDVVWLKNNREPWPEVEYKWAITFSARQVFFKTDRTINEILEEYPNLTNQLGYQLIDADFQKKYPQYYRNIYQHFENAFYKLLEYRKQSSTLNPADLSSIELLEANQTNKNLRHFLMLSLLASLLPAKSKRVKNKWHPNKQECKEGVIVQIKSFSEIKAVVEERKVLLKKYKHPSLPFVIVETPSATEVRNVWVSFEQVLYKPTSVVQAVDICFQMIHVLNLVYPYQSAHIWLFIQLAMYKMATRFDNIPNIVDICKKIETTSI